MPDAGTVAPERLVILTALLRATFITEADNKADNLAAKLPKNSNLFLEQNLPDSVARDVDSVRSDC